jgi:hypothetical protein
MAANNFDASKIHMGPASVTWGDTHLGYTLNDSVKVNIPTETTPVTPDQASLAIMDVVTSTAVTVEATFAQVEDILQLMTGVEADADTGGYVFKDPGGVDLKQIAKPLVLAPYDINAEDDITPSGLVYTFPKACPVVTDGFSFAKTTPQGITLSFKVYADDDGVFMKWAKNTPNA